MNSLDYNAYVLERINSLLDEKRDYYIDFHIHTNFSADGTQEVIEAVQRAKKIGFDIISITDHDSIGAYDIIMNMSFAQLDNFPIIIPGVEFSVDYGEYKSRTHVLKYFFSLDCKGFKENLAKNREAFRERAKKQFELIEYNKTLKFYQENNSVQLSFDRYVNFLKENMINIFDYSTLMKYIYHELKRRGVSIWDVYKMCCYYNNEDDCGERKQLVKNALDKFYQKNKNKYIEENSYKLSKILAIVEVDDSDYPDYRPFGNLTVNQYGQVKVGELENCGFNILAHPNREQITRYLINRNIFSGIELNYRSTDKENEQGKRIADKLRCVV